MGVYIPIAEADIDKRYGLALIPGGVAETMTRV
jgi:hypothetical protein